MEEKHLIDQVPWSNYDNSFPIASITRTLKPLSSLAWTSAMQPLRNALQTSSFLTMSAYFVSVNGRIPWPS